MNVPSSNTAVTRRNKMSILAHMLVAVALAATMISAGSFRPARTFAASTNTVNNSTACNWWIYAVSQDPLGGFYYYVTGNVNVGATYLDNYLQGPGIPGPIVVTNSNIGFDITDWQSLEDVGIAIGDYTFSDSLLTSSGSVWFTYPLTWFSESGGVGTGFFLVFQTYDQAQEPTNPGYDYDYQEFNAGSSDDGNYPWLYACTASVEMSQ